MKWKKGDTLVEVAFALGVFSLVAITVVAVISASTSATQATLETTLTREDIDSQAEALRFIHDSYISGTQSASTGDNPYSAFWNAITGLAYNPTDTVKTYRPETCTALYDNGWVLAADSDPSQPGNAKPFIINVRQLYNTSNANDVIRPSTYTPTGTTGPFAPAETYPRILYGDMTTEDLYTQSRGNDSISRVEGLFIVAVKGENVNVISGTTTGSHQAYYDFYIRSCWMPVNSDRASTISTLVRLYDPAIIH